jgi:hypothetical protein
MRSVTLAQAALFAALAMALLTGYQLIDNFALIRDTPALVLLGSTAPGIVWAGYFFALYRDASSARTAAWIVLVFAVLLEAVVVSIRFQRSVNYWTPFGNALSLSGWLLRLGWAVFLIAFALTPEHAPDSSRTRQIALLLAILSAPSALSAAYSAFNNGIGFLFGDIPRQALWRALITPVIRTIYWLSQILFLWTVWGKPQKRDPVEASSLRLTP